MALQGGIPGDVAVDAAGNLLWVGGFSQFIDFGGGSHFVNDPAPQSYLVKYAADGTYAWSKAFGDPSSFDVAWDVATDGAGNVFVLGSFNNTFDVGLGPLTSAGLSDLYLIKLAPDGTPLWAKSYGTAQANEGMGAVATDSAGNVYLHVQHWASGSYGGMPLPSTGPGNIAIAKYDPQGNHVWSKSCTGSPSGAPTSLAIDASDNLLLTGTFEQTLDCGGGNPLVGGSQNTYVIKLDPLGNYLWGIAPSVAPSSTTIQDVAVDAFGNVYLAGFFSGVVDFGGVLMAPTMPWSAFSVKLSPAGAHLASAKYGAGATAFDVGVDAVGSVFLVGSFSNAIDLGAGVLTAPPNLKSAFLARLP